MFTGQKDRKLMMFGGKIGDKPKDYTNYFVISGRWINDSDQMDFGLMSWKISRSLSRSLMLNLTMAYVKKVE
uniref:Uncharacterized protein n=1 Tax=Tetranychus urticae TaxID=32264 RepID=T1L1Y3_TETUR